MCESISHALYRSHRIDDSSLCFLVHLHGLSSQVASPQSRVGVERCFVLEAESVGHHIQGNDIFCYSKRGQERGKQGKMESCYTCGGAARFSK